MRCKHCKEKFDPLHFNQKFCFKEECKSVWIETEKEKQWRKRKKEIKEDLKTVQDLLKETQIVFNEFIRLRDRGKPCISCGNKKPKKINAGHFISSGSCKILTFNLDNVHLQCEYCNTYLSGNLINYRLGLIQRIGIERVEALESRRNQTARFTREELKEIKEQYKQKIKELKKSI